MSKLIHSIDTPQTLRALCLHSFIHKTQSEHLLRTCSIPDTRDPAVNKAGKFSVFMMHTFQRVTDHEIKHACTSTSAYEELTSLGIALLSKTNKKMGKIHETIFFRYWPSDSTGLWDLREAMQTRWLWELPHLSTWRQFLACSLAVCWIERQVKELRRC